VVDHLLCKHEALNLKKKTQIYEANMERSEERNSSRIIVGNFKTSLNNGLNTKDKQLRNRGVNTITN
jgi:hypothetical protein